MKIKVNGVVCHSMADVRDNASGAFADFVEEYFNGNEYVTAHTSGSTGDPKAIKLLKIDMRASAQMTNEFFGIDEASVLYLPLSPTYIAGKMMIVRALEANASIYEETPSNSPLSSYEGPAIDLLAVVPSQLGYLINTPGLLEKVKAMIIGGGKLPERVERWLAERGANAYKTYGMTETCSHVALSKVSATGALPYVGIGNTTFACDARGCLVINAPQFSSPRYVTNDVVKLVDDRHFYWLGRIDNVINTGGLKVFPEEVETALAGLIPHSRFFITSRPSEKWGEEVVLAIEYRSLPEGTVREGKIKQAFVEQMKKVLPAQSVPRRYIAVSKFKETSSGKIIRRIDNF